MNNVLIDADDIQNFDFESAKKDTVASKTQPGDLVIPVEMTKIDPELYEGIRMAMAMNGVNPNTFTAGHPEGQFNPLTGDQQFFLKKIAKAVKKTVKKISSNPIGRTLLNVGAAVVSGGNPYVIGATNAVTAKAAGASDTSALLSGLGAGVGAGLMKGTATGAQSVGTKLSTPSTGFGSSLINPIKSGLNTGLNQIGGMGGIGGTIANAISSTPVGAITGAQLGGSLGSMAGYYIDPPKMPTVDLNTLTNVQPTLPTLPAQQVGNLVSSGLGQNQALNYVTTPNYQAFTPGTMAANYLSPAVNRYSNTLMYQPTMFRDRLNENSRRSGLSRGGFGQGVLYY